MAGYPINLSNGTLITTVSPGTFNTTTFNIALLGRGVSNYGEIMAENMVHMLENFAANQPPGVNPNISGNPVTGQLWYNTQTDTLFIYDSTTTPNWRQIVISGGSTSFTAPNGTIANPGINFVGNTASGFSFTNTPTNTINISIGGSLSTSFTAQGAGFLDGTAPQPSIFFINDTDTGIFRSGPNNVSITANGSSTSFFNPQGVGILTGTAATPSLFFATDSDTGIFSNGPNILAIAANGSPVSYFTPQGIGILTGSPTTPSLFFANDPDTGIYNNAPNMFTITAGGLPVTYFTPQGAGVIDGSESSPSLFFAFDPDTGIFRSGSNQLGITTNGTRKLVATATGGIFYGNWTLATGATLQATYADLAERYHADQPMEPGDVVCLGGEFEITLSKKACDTNVFGVVSENPAFGMNSNAGNNTTHPYVALSGRVKVKVIGSVTKGQRLVTSHLPGIAMAEPNDQSQICWRSILGRSLQNKTDDQMGTIEAVVGVK